MGATRIELCGALRVEIDGERKEAELRGRQGRMILAYLVLNRGRAVRRDELADVLWSHGGPPEGGESLLAPPLSRLRRTLGAQWLVGRSELRLVLPEDASVDWEEAHAALGEARAAAEPRLAWDAAARAEAIAAGGLLAGLEAPWIDVRRAELGDLRLEAFELRAAAGMRLGGLELAEAERAARAAVEAAPFRESARAALMEVLAARGNAAEALRVFEDLRVLLREELGASPGAAVVAVHERLLQADAAPGGPAAIGAPPAIGGIGGAAAGAPPPPAGLVERDRELSLLARVSAEALGGAGHTALIEGPAGIGKTRLLAELRRQADAAGARVLAARASDLERDFPFGVVRQLFESLLLEPGIAERAFAGAAAPARAAFETPGGDQGGAFAILHGLFWVTFNLAAERPLAIVCDDVHWADQPSLRFLAYLARRVEGQPVLLAATLRTGEPGTDLALMAEIAEDGATVSVRPPPLSEAAVREVVRGRLGAEADDAFCAACHSTTGGNPLFLRQLLTALEAEGVRPDAAHADVVRAIGSRAIAASVVRRLSRLPAGAGEVARAVAVLGDGADLRAVSELAELDDADAATAAAALSRAEILRPDAPLAFVHPLVRDAVYRDIPPGERELRHERAARVLRDAGAPTDQVAGHLLWAPRRGEQWVAGVLHEAGSAAMRRGATESAVAHLRRALEEPPPSEVRPPLLLELGLAELLSSEPLRPDRLQEAFETLTDPGLRLVAAHALSRTLIFGGEPEAGVAVVERAMAELPPDAEEDRLALNSVRTTAVWFGAGDPSVLAELEPWRERPLRTLGEKMMGASAALECAYRGLPADVTARVALASLDGGELIAADNGLHSNAAIAALAMADREEVVGAIDAALADAYRQGSLYSISGLHIWRGFTSFVRGDLDDAAADLEAAIHEAQIYAYSENVRAYSAAFLARTLTERGDLEGAWRALATANPAGQNERVEGFRHWRNARLELLVAEGRDGEVEAAAAEARRRVPGWENPCGHRWRSLLGVVLARNGRREEGLALVEDELAEARRVGAPGTLGRSLRVAGELRGDEAMLREAVGVLDGSPARLELAKALTAYGTVDALQRGLALAEGCGAAPVAARASAELARLGATPGHPTSDLLGGTERRVAALAAEGRGDREIAEALYLTPHDVAGHLAAATRKLGVTSRGELASALTRP